MQTNVQANAKGATSVVGFFVEDVQEVFDRIISAAALVINPVTDYDYGQGARNVQGSVWASLANMKANWQLSIFLKNTFGT